MTDQEKLQMEFNRLIGRIARSPYSVAAVARQAGVHDGWLRNVNEGKRPLTQSTFDLVERAFHDLEKERPGITDEEGFRLYRLALALVIRHADQHLPDLAGADIQTVLDQEPARRATEDPVWLQAAHLRRAALYLAYIMFPLTQARIGRIAGLKKASVSLAIKEIELEREDNLNRFEQLFAFYEGLK